MTVKDFELPTWQEIKAVFALGLPVSITLVLEVTMFSAVALMIARYPVEIMGAHQIAINIAYLTFMVPLGLSQAISARVGYFVGKEDWPAVRLAGSTGIIICVMIMFASAMMMICWPRELVGIYTSDPSLIDLASSLLFFAAIFQLFDGLQVASTGALRGIKDMKVPLGITVVSYWLIGIPFGYYLAEHQGLGVKGYWMGLIVGLAVAAGLLLLRWAMLGRRVRSI